MVYPFDVETGSELTNSSMTENGFKLDLAKSRYLRINVKREILTESADGLVEDTRFNGPAKDGAEYIEEGIYTITVTNQYTNQTTTKKIYVGTNSILKAHVATGLPISEINTLISQGAVIDENGVITLETLFSTEVQENETESQTQTIEESKEQNEEETSGKSIFEIGSIIVLCMLGGLFIIGIFIKLKNTYI